MAYIIKAYMYIGWYKLFLFDYLLLISNSIYKK